MSRLAAWWENDFLQNVARCGLAGAAMPAAMLWLARHAGFFSPVTTPTARPAFTTPRRVRFVEMEYALLRRCRRRSPPRSGSCHHQ